MKRRPSTPLGVNGRGRPPGVNGGAEALITFRFRGAPGRRVELAGDPPFWTEPHPISGRARPAIVPTFAGALRIAEDLARP